MRVVIAEDLFLLRDGLTRMLQAHGLQVTTAVDNGTDLLAAVTADKPDVAIVDVRLPPTFTDEGLRAALAARRELAGLPVLVLSQYVEQLYARELLASGTGGIGYLLKDRVFDSAQCVDAVRRVAGGTAMDPEVVARLLARNSGDGALAALSPRERQVLALMAKAVPTPPSPSSWSSPSGPSPSTPHPFSCGSARSRPATTTGASSPSSPISADEPRRRAQGSRLGTQRHDSVMVGTPARVAAAWWRRRRAMRDPGQWVVVGLDNGGTTNNATVLDSAGRFLVDRMAESPSCVQDGPGQAIEALARSLDQVLELTGISRAAVRAVGLDTPGPVSADGIISSKGATNFSGRAWHGFDVRGALETRLRLPVLYNNDANAAALYAHHVHFGSGTAELRSSVSVIVGTGLGGGVIEGGRVVRGAAGMAGELGHIWIPMDGLLGPGQPVPACNCGLPGDAESVASLTAIEKNLLPYWLTRFPGHELGSIRPASRAARLVRGYGEAGDALALEIFGQQAMAVGRLFTIAANFTDPDVYFLGGGVVEAAPHFRDWFLGRVREHTVLREEQALAASIALVPDLDMAGARGSAIAARAAVL